MREGQAQFPYVLITENAEIALKVNDFSFNGVQSGLGVFTFRSECLFDEIFRALDLAGTDFSLVQVYDVNYKGDGIFSRVFGHIN